MRRPSKIPPFVLAFFMADFALAFAHLANTLLGWPLGQTLAMEMENNLPTWYASTQLFVLAALLAVFAVRNFDRSFSADPGCCRRYHWSFSLCQSTRSLRYTNGLAR